ncbi:hypothetical protein FRB96_008191 [Tulasnella sp. 330]|nr:hypothetical protein FRB96_008191 [Tulasnella sp. 330]
MIQTPLASSTVATPLKSTKKRKAGTSTPDGQSTTKKPKKDRRNPKNVFEATATPLGGPSTPANTRIRGKRKASFQEEEDMSEFAVVRASVLLSIPPVFSSDPSAGVEEMLDSMGIVLSHSNHQFLSSSAAIQNDSPYTLCRVAFDATVWSPKIGMTLVGRVNLFSPDHISLLIHRTFNISIPRSHIPDSQYVFEYGSKDWNKDDYDKHITKSSASSSSYIDPDHRINLDDKEYGVKRERVEPWVVEENTERMVESVGHWVTRATGEKIGGPNGTVQFTIVGMTLANQMISLIGSLRSDPFDPRHSDPASKLLHRPVPETLVGDDDEESLPDLNQLAVSEGADPPTKRRKKAGDDGEKGKEEQKEARRPQGVQLAGTEARPKKKKRRKRLVNDESIPPSPC